MTRIHPSVAAGELEDVIRMIAEFAGPAREPKTFLTAVYCRIGAS